MSYTSKWYGNEIDEAVGIALQLDPSQFPDKEEINEIKESLATQADSLAAQENRIGIVEEEVSGIGARVTTNEEELEKKVDKVAGLGLSQNSFTNNEKTKLAGLENYDDSEIKEEIKSNQTSIKNNTDDIEANTAAITMVSEAISGMSRTLTARTEAEVREALQFAADHPGSYLNLTLAAGLNATIPTLYFRNCAINIYGTPVNDEISNTITFEKTGTTSNMHLQNSMLYTQKIRYIGNTNGSTRGIGVIRGETGSAIFANNLEFGQAEGSGNFGNNIEVQNGATVYAENCKFRAMSTHSVAAVVFCIAGARATTKDCSIVADSTVQRLGNAENGGFINQIGSEKEVLITNGGMYALNGILQNQA